MPAQRHPESVGRFIVSGYHGSSARLPRQDSLRASLAKIHKAVGTSRHDRKGLEFVFAHGLAVSIKPALNPRVRSVARKINQLVSLFDEVTRGLKRPAEVIEAYLVVNMRSVHSNDVIAESHEWHVDRFDSAQKVWIDRACQDDAVNQAVLLKDRRQVDFFGGRSLRIVQHGKEHVVLQRACIRFDALQNARVKRVKKIAVAQEKANNFGTPLEDPAGLRVGAESKAPDGLVHAGARFPAHLRAGIQHAGNCSDAHARGPGHVADGTLPWNCFHSPLCLLRLPHLSSTLLEFSMRASVAQSAVKEPRPKISERPAEQI